MEAMFSRHSLASAAVRAAGRQTYREVTKSGKSLEVAARPAAKIEYRERRELSAGGGAPRCVTATRWAVAI
ncbi:MAG: hypothetical protein ACRERS_03480 [Methylococcales bacterium]